MPTHGHEGDELWLVRAIYTAMVRCAASLDEADVERGARSLARPDLSARRYVCVEADGIYLQARLDDEKQCIVVAIGATPEGRFITRTILHWDRSIARSRVDFQLGRRCASVASPYTMRNSTRGCGGCRFNHK